MQYNNTSQPNKSLYDRDFYAWTQEQAQLIKAKRFTELDIDNLFEEVEDMGNRHADGVESRMEVLLMHLLKWKYQAKLRSNSWLGTIEEQRFRIKKQLKKMPSLKSKFDEMFIEAYEDAVYEAAKETKLPAKTFPKICEWTLKQMLDDDFLPN